jgi:hypothetical protein
MLVSCAGALPWTAGVRDAAQRSRLCPSYFMASGG